MKKRIIGITLIVTSLIIFALYLSAANQQLISSSEIIIIKKGSQPSTQAQANYFTGKVRVDFLTRGYEPSKITAAYVTFQSGARTAWHSHPVGQTLIVTSGTGWVQQWGKIKRIIHKGDVVFFPPYVKHWHGATTNSPMVHIAIQEKLNGNTVSWMEKVSDKQYLSGTNSSR